MSEARDAFEAMIRYELGPLLREGGLSGTYREFRLREGEYEGVIAFEGWAKANRGNTYTFDFRIELRDRLTKKWLRELPRLSNLAVADSKWTVVPGEPTLALAQELARLILRYAVTAVRMEILYPDMPELPNEFVSRSHKELMAFNRERTAAMQDIPMARPKLSKDELLAYFRSGDGEHRRLALLHLVRRFPDDPETIQGVKDSLVDTPIMRYEACFHVRRLGLSGSDVVQALTGQLHVERPLFRWEARFDLMLLGEDQLVAFEEAKRRPFPPLSESPPPKVLSLEEILTMEGNHADSRITPFTAAVLSSDEGATTRHAILDGDNLTLCGIGKSEVRRLSACFLLEDERSCGVCSQSAGIGGRDRTGNGEEK